MYKCERAAGQANHQSSDTTPSIVESVTVRRLGKRCRVVRSAGMMSRVSTKNKKSAPRREQRKYLAISV